MKSAFAKIALIGGLLFFLSPLNVSNAFAATNCPQEQSGVRCTPDYLMGGVCIAASTAQTWYDECRSQTGRALDCSFSTKKCICTAGYEDDPNAPGSCRALCPSGQTYCSDPPRSDATNPASCVAIDYAPIPGIQTSVDPNACANNGMSLSNACTGVCTSCSGGRVNYNGICVLPSTLVWDAAANAFFGLDIVNNLWKSITGVWTQNGNDIYNNNTGNVGIGNPSPLWPLDVKVTGATTNNSYGGLITNTSSSSTDNKWKAGLYVQSTGVNNWTGSGSVNAGLIVNGTGGANNYSALFYGGDVGILGTGLGIGGGFSDLTHKLDVIGGARIAGDLELNVSSNNLTKINTGTSVGKVEIGNPANQVEVNSSTWGVNGAGSAGFTSLGVSGPVTITDGTQGAGKVLTSDASGLASWQNAGIGFFVGVSAAYNGNRGGYKLADDLCKNLSAPNDGSHICTPEEMVNSYVNQSAGPISTATGKAWINHGPPGYQKTFSNDCGGWTQLDDMTYGSVWNFNTDDSRIQPCSATDIPFSCCK